MRCEAGIVVEIGGGGAMASADVTLEMTLPNSLESERAILAAILLDEKAIFAATEILTVDDFYLEAHREIFRAMLSLVLARQHALRDLAFQRGVFRAIDLPHPALAEPLEDAVLRDGAVDHGAIEVGSSGSIGLGSAAAFSAFSSLPPST